MGVDAEADERLAPGADPDDVRAAASGRGETVVVVGHQPDCGRTVAALSGGPEPRVPAGRRRRGRGLMAAAVDVSGLRKSYGDHEAVRGITFRIEEGEVFCLLGPNGAGKTTTVEILEGYRARDAGEVTVLGLDPGRRERTLRERMGVVLQHSETWPQVTVAETLRIYAGYYKNPRDVDEVIELVGLVEKRDARIKTLSGGQKRRLDLGLALVGNPDLVFLDEPTTGFDPQARRNAWEMIRGLRALGKTILLTTHYLDEAQQLADRVAVLRDGVIVTEGTPAELVASSRTEIRYRENGEVKVVETDEPTRALHELTSRAVAQGRELEELEVRRRSLEDVYLELLRRGRRREPLRPSGPSGPARLLARPRERDLRLPLPGAPVPAPVDGVLRRVPRPAEHRLPDVVADRVRGREHRRSVGSRSSS